MRDAPHHGAPRLLLIPGSQRRESFNARLLAHLAQRLQGQCEVDLLDARDVDLPLFDQDLEGEPRVLGPVATLLRRIEASQGLIVASPEYNGQLTPFLKNLVDWTTRLPHIDASFANPFIDRPLLLCSASTGWSGGAMAIPSARALFGYVGCVVIGDTVCVPRADQAWTGDGYAFDPFFDDQVDASLERVLQLARGFAAQRGASHPIPA